MSVGLHGSSVLVVYYTRIRYIDRGGLVTMIVYYATSTATTASEAL